MLGRMLLKESIADIVIQVHYEQRFLDLKYIFQQRPSWFKDKWLAKHGVVAESINTQVSQRNEFWSQEMGSFIRESDCLGSI